MSSSEIGFLALGLILGGALGAAFLAAVRSRPVPRREVRLTIAPNSIGARRSVTLADPMALRTRPSPPGSPDAAAWSDDVGSSHSAPVTTRMEAPLLASHVRTRVPSATTVLASTVVAVPVVSERPVTALDGTSPAPIDRPWGGTNPVSPVPDMGAVAGSNGSAPSWPTGGPPPAAVLDIGRPAPERMVRPRPPVHEMRPILAAAAVGIPIASADDTSADVPREPSPASPASTAPAALSGEVDPCAPARTAAEARCLEAASWRERARVASDAVREAKRAIDELHERVDTARETSDPRVVAAQKVQLQAEYREASSAAVTPDQAEAAARRWLTAIDRTNTEARAALRLVETATAELNVRLPALERLAAEADAARITAESAEQGCRTAREELARCEEQALAATLPPAAEPAAAEAPHPLSAAWPSEPGLSPDTGGDADAADDLAAPPVIFRVLRGDRDARERFVAALAGDEPASVDTWRLRVSALVDAIVTRAIEAGYLDFPDDEPFWRLFTQPERREIVGALSSLGFRFDGLGGFADARVPAARDLSLAVGYAGLDPMRIRVWPRDAELGNLYARARVEADAWLATRADDLALGAMVDALGPQADGLGEIWNAWGRVRTVLLASD